MDTLEQFILSNILANVNTPMGDMEDWSVTKFASGAMVFENKKIDRTINVAKQGVERIIKKLEAGE